MPTWFDDLAPMTWGEVPGTRVFGDYIPNNTYPPAWYSYKNTVNAWNGMCLKTAGSLLIAPAQGGHGDYAGNQVIYLPLNSETPQWTERDPGSNPADVLRDVPYYADGRGTSVHGYAHMHFLDGEDRVIRTPTPAMWGTGFYSPQCSAFDWVLGAWSPSLTVPSLPTITQLMAGASCKHPTTEELWYWRGGVIRKWDRLSNTWIVVKKQLPSNVLWMPAAIDPVRNEMVLVQGGTTGVLYVYDIAVNTMLTVTPTGPETSALIDSGKYCRLIYVPPLGKYLFMRGALVVNADRLYSITPGTWVVEDFPVAGVIPAATRGVNGRLHFVPELNGVVYVPAAEMNVKFFRL